MFCRSGVVSTAILAARRRTRRSPLLRGSSPASSAAIAASQSMLASMVPWSLPSTAVMNRLVKSSRRSQQPHPMMSSVPASRA
jgi:hypothetical protein